MPDEKRQIAETKGPELDRGREADHPQEIPAKGWKDIVIRAWRHSSERNLSLVAGGVTYYVLIALFPGLAALVSIYGLVANPHQVETEVGAMSGLMAPSAQKLISDELHQLVSASSGTLGFGVVIGILIALYSASSGMSSMITALDIAYGEEEKRGIVKFYLLAVALTIVMLIGGIIAIALVAVLPAALSSSNTSGITKWIGYIVEWPLLIAFMLGMLAILYRYAPDRRKASWKWITPGAITATGLWIIGSVLFTVYVSNFSNYNKTYGSLGALVVLLTWLWLSTYVVLLGAEINAEAERQTRKDTTVGGSKPMGERDAVAADTLGKSHGK